MRNTYREYYVPVAPIKLIRNINIHYPNSMAITGGYSSCFNVASSFWPS